MDNYTHFEHLSVTGGVGVIVLDTGGRTLFESSVHAAASYFLETLYEKLDCGESSRVAFLYGCYQARRFGGRYVFFAPSGLVYCAAPLLDHKGTMVSGVLAGPFLMNSHEEYIQDLSASLSKDEAGELYSGIRSIPYIEPRRAHSISEHLYYVAAAYSSQTVLAPPAPVQTDLFSTAYPIEKEGELLTAISKGDIHTVNVVLGDILGQILFHCGGNLEVLRSRVVELTVLLSRAALKGGADINAILGLNYDYLREIDSFSSIEDIVLWLHTVTRRFTQQVFDFSGTKHMDIIYKAVDYIKRNYASKLTLGEIADHLFISRQYFCRIFKEETGQTPGGYITFVRIEESKKLLRNSAVNIIDIPEYVGLESQSYFTKMFKRETGTTPGQYRRENIVR
ncbi:MAG: AraC family transcriptional regulator [Oscillospiraceae bacterium]|nr:AraC family transcriptional regulator [Oscillospiraceae bacterium]